jgi:hypothetical protein
MILNKIILMINYMSKHYFYSNRQGLKMLSLYIYKYYIMLSNKKPFIEIGLK